MDRQFYHHDEVMRCRWFTKLIETDTMPSSAEFEAWTDNYEFGNYAVRLAYCQTYGFAMMTEEVIADMAGYLKPISGRILEVCCGTGYLSYRLKEAGIDVIATDNRDWRDTREDFFANDYTDIEDLDAVDAIEKYSNDIDVVIVSWPNYGSDVAYEILKKCLQYDLKLIYIGEDEGGCTANDDFFDLIRNGGVSEDLAILDMNYVQFPGIHDHIWLLNS